MRAALTCAARGPGAAAAGARRARRQGQQPGVRPAHARAQPPVHQADRLRHDRRCAPPAALQPASSCPLRRHARAALAGACARRLRVRCRRTPMRWEHGCGVPVTGRGRCVPRVRKAEGSARGLSIHASVCDSERSCLNWAWADAGAHREHACAGMASEGIITMLTQYLQLKLGYETSDQARARAFLHSGLCLPPVLSGPPTVVQHGCAPGRSCQHVAYSSLAPRQRRPGARTACGHGRGGLGGGRAGEAVRGRGCRGAGDQHAAAAQPARLARQSPPAVAWCGPGRAQSPSVARRMHV